jgi:hypothetical protein
MTDTEEYINVVSFSIIDADEEKHQIAVENAKLVSKLFPGWKGHFYVPSDLPESIKEQISAQENCSVYMIEQNDDAIRDTWSFMPLGQPNVVSSFIARRGDQLITDEDVQQVKAWMESPFQFSVRALGEGLDMNSFAAKLHGPINTIWMIHYLHTTNSDGVIDILDLFNRFYGAFSFLFQPAE